MDALVLKIAELLEANKIINKNDMELYKYGLEIFIMTVVELGAVLLVSAIIGNFVETFIFLIGFMPIRIYAGGYHADTRLRCFLVLLMVYIFFSILLNRVEFINYKYLVMLISASGILSIALISPIKHKNKRITESEGIRYKTIAIILSTIESAIIDICMFLNYSNLYVNALVIGLFTAIISLLAGKIKTTIEKGGV